MQLSNIGYSRRMGADGAKAFSPIDLPGLKLWPRYNQGITVTGAGVSQWNDQSGEGNHLKQGTDTNQPSKESDGSILCDGVDNFLKADTFTWEQPETIYILVNSKTWTFGDRIFDGLTGNTGGLVQKAITPDILINAGSDAATNSDLVLDTYLIISTVFNGVSSSIQVNNGTPTTGNAGALDMNGFTLGAFGGGGSSWSHAQFKEVIGYNTAHDAATKAKVIAYLASVGGLSI